MFLRVLCEGDCSTYDLYMLVGLGEHIETHRRVAIKFVCLFLIASSYSSLVLMFVQIKEPRKSDAPQLRDEYRSYRTLRHIRTYSFRFFVYSNAELNAALYHCFSLF